MSKLLQALTKVLREFGLIPRAIKDVDAWDGSPSRWETTAAYCDACLINVNTGDREDWVQALCKLPVREPGDGADTYVRQAVYAAAGGRGLSRVEKPADVTEEAWESAVQSAAVQLIAAYDEMEETAPDTIYELAGRERALSAYRLYDALWDQIYERDELYLLDTYLDESGTYGLAARNGQLFKIPVTANENDELVLGETVPVTEVHVPRARTHILRQADGRARWFSVSCVAVINRVGEIDSRELFDNLADNVERHGYPIRQFYHAGEAFRTGQCDFVARYGYALITSGLYDDSELAEREIAAREADPDYWGESINYWPLDGEVQRVGDVDVPVYTDGYLTEISTLPETDAASPFTLTTQTREVGMKLRLNDRQYAAFVKLFGDDEEAAKGWLETNADDVNRWIENGDDVIARAKAAQAPEPEDEVTEAEGEVSDVMRTLTENQEVLRQGYEDLVEQVTQGLTDIHKRLDAIEQQAQERAAQFQITGAPRRMQLTPVKLQRPRQAATDTEAGQEDPVTQTLKSKGFTV